MPNWISFSQKERRGTHHSSTGRHLSKPIIKTEKEEEGYYGLNTSSPGPVWEGLCTWILPCFVTQDRRPETCWLVSNFRIIFLPFTTFSCSVGYFYEVNVSLQSYHFTVRSPKTIHGIVQVIAYACKVLFFSKAILPPTFQGSWCHSNYLNFQKTDLPQSPSVKTPSKITLVTLRRKQGWIWSLYH